MVVLFILCPLGLVAQLQCNTCIVQVLKKELQAVGQRGLGGHFGLKFDKSEGIPILRMGSLTISTEIRDQLGQSLVATCGSCITDSLLLTGYIKFDNYSDSVFIRVGPPGSNVIFQSVEITLTPRGGMDNFIGRWSQYIDSLRTLKLISSLAVDSATYVPFYVEKNGELLTNDTSDLSWIIKGFIKKEKKWNPGIQSGRHTITTYKIEIPLRKNKKPRIYRHRTFTNRVVSELLGLHYSHSFPKGPLVNNIVSVVSIEGRYSTPIIHQGTKTDGIIDFLMDKNTFALISDRDFSRIYFYTLSP